MSPILIVAIMVLLYLCGLGYSWSDKLAETVGLTLYWGLVIFGWVVILGAILRHLSH